MEDERVPPGLKNLIYGVISALIVQAIGFMFWGFYISWSVGAYEARFDDRLSALEKSWSVSQAIEAKLDAAQRATDLHNAVWDQKMNDLTSKVEAVLDSMRQDTPPAAGGGMQSAPPNFPQRPPGGP